MSLGAPLRSSLLALVIALESTACANETPGPETALHAAAAALRSAGGDTTALPTQDEREALADTLEHAPLVRRAHVAIASSEGTSREVVLVEEEGTLRVESGVLGVPTLDTPERAIAALHRAIVRELALGPGPLLVDVERRAWLEERTRYRDGTADPDGLDVRVDGDSATATTPLGDQIVLLREGAEWRVSSVRAAGLE